MFNKSFTERDSSSLIFESIKALKMIISFVYNFLPITLCLPCFLFYFLIIDIYILIATDIARIFNPTAEHKIPIGLPTNKSKLESETHPLIAETNTSNCSK